MTMTLMINEIFYSLQGESTWMGLPCVFIRLSGCNLRCRYCDTQYAYEPGDPMGVDDVIAAAARYKCSRLTITGGEPLLQEHTPLLVSLLLENGFDVSLETNGSLSIESLDDRCMKVMDLKCPSSGMQAHNRMENIKRLGSRDQIKFVVANREDYHFALSMASRLASDMEAERILMSPVHGVLSPTVLAEWMIESRAHARLQLQLHKLLWPERDRGV